MKPTKPGKKGQAGLPMNFLVLGVIIVLVLAGVFYAIIRSEAVRKLRELPMEEEEVEEEVELQGEACPVEIGYMKEEGGLKYFYLKNAVVRTDFYIAKHHWMNTYNWMKEDFVWLDKSWSNKEIGFIDEESVPGQRIFRVYCDRAVDINNLIPVSRVLDLINNAYFIGGIAAGGKTKVCKQNTTQYDLDSCVDGERYKNLIREKIIDSYFISLKRGSTEIVKLNSACLDKLNFKRSIIFDVAHTLFMDPREFIEGRDDSQRFKDDKDNYAFKIFFEFVFDNCQKATFAILSIARSEEFKEWDVNIYKGKKSATPEEMKSLLFSTPYTKKCEDGFLGNASEVCKKADTKETFVSEILKFSEFFCNHTSWRAECILGNKKTGFATRFIGFEALKKTKCSEFREMKFKDGHVKTELQLNTISDASCSQCDSENGYECRIEKDGKLGDWEKCKIVGEKFCSKADDTKCVEYKWNDRLEFMSWTKQKYALQLTQEGLKSA